APRESVLDSRFPAPKDGRPLRVASVLEQVSKQWIARTGLDARFVRTYGATEVFPPEDADMIIDVTQTGATLEANGLVIIDDVMTSATRLYASSRALDVPEKRRKLEELVVLLSSVLDARGRVLIDMNVAEDQLEALVKVLPCMREPTVSRLHAQRGYAVRVAAPQKDLPRLVPLIKQHGGSDIVVSQVQQVVP
ncbi:MAG: ATP phosphoribosyltransferase, partial [Planctomycetota bacterium]